VGAFFRRRFGDEAARLLAQPLLGGIHAGDVDELSMQALFPELARADRAGGSLRCTQAIAASPRGR
jgi:oxygen-dependent protoporphyrinogen oxidase